MLRAIRMCLWPKMDNGNKTTRLLVSLGFASGTNFTSGIIYSLTIAGWICGVFLLWITSVWAYNLTVTKWLRIYKILIMTIIQATLRYCLSRQYKGATTLVNHKCPPIGEWYDIWTVALAVLIHCIRLPRAWFLHLGLPGLLQYCRRWTTLLSRRQENESQSG